MLFEGFESIRRIFVFIFVALVIAFITIAFIMKIEEAGRKTPASIEITDGLIRIIKNGKAKWEFRVDKIVMSPDEKKYKFTKIHDGIFQRSDRPPLTFTAGSGSYDSTREKLLLEGNFAMTSKNGDFFRAASAEWDGMNKRLSIPTQVAFSSEGNAMRGGRLEAWGDDLTVFSVSKDVFVTIADLQKMGGEKTKKEIEETSIDETYFKKLSITAQLVEYDRLEKVMKVYPNPSSMGIFLPGRLAPQPTDRVTLEGKNFILKSREMFLDMERKAAQATGQVWALKKAETKSKKNENDSKVKRAFLKKDSAYETEQANLFWKEGFLDFPYTVTMTKTDMTAIAGRAFVDIKRDTAVLSNGVRLHQAKGDWLLDEGVVDKDASKKTKDAVREETTVVCDNMDMDSKNDALNAYGGVTVTQKNRNLSGGSAHYDGDKKAWSVFGDSFYKDKDYRITADRFVYYENEKIFEALDSVYAEKAPDEDQRKDISDYYEERDGERPDEKSFSRDNIKVTARKLRYDEKKDALTAEGDAKLIFRDATIISDNLFVDYKSDTARGDGGVSFDDTRNHITASKFTVDWNDKSFNASGNVRMRDAGRKTESGREEQESMNLDANSLEYEWKNKKGVAEGKVNISAEGRRSSAARLDFDRGTKTYKLSGDVKIHQDSGDWLDKRDVFGEDDDKAKRLAKKPTDITCETAFFDDGNDRSTLSGGVYIVQQHREIRARTITADSKRKIFEADGSVKYSQDSGDWIFDEKFIDEDVEEDVEKKARGALEITAARLISEYGENKIFVDGGVKFTQGANSAASDKAWHYGDSKRTVFEGHVNFIDDRGRDFKAERVVYDRASKTVEAFKSVKGSTDLSELKKKNNM
ncbi:MAG: LPS export ABC transporter periplasmic protein LptC [bacterium]